MYRCKQMRIRGFNLRAPSVTRWVAALSASLVFIRFFVLFCESFSVVRSERLADADLLELCGRGAAADSQKFRSLCLQAKAERAAPLLFKAVLRAMRTAFHDFAESFNSPSKIAILLLFVVSGLALPVVKAVSSLATAHLGPFRQPNTLSRIHGLDDDLVDAEDPAGVVVIDTDQRRRLSWPRRLRPRSSHAQRARSLTLIDCDEEDAHDATVWTSIKLGKGE
jgi:hypothetical protein